MSFVVEFELRGWEKASQFLVYHVFSKALLSCHFLPQNPKLQITLSDRRCVLVFVGWLVGCLVAWLVCCFKSEAR